MRLLNTTNPVIDDLFPFLQQSGYIINAKEFAFTREHNFVRYEGYDSARHQHTYLVGMFEEGEYYVTRVLVYLNKNGLIEGEYAGMPCYMFDEFDMLDKFFSSLK